MAMTMVQQCKAWFEAGMDDQIIDLVYKFAQSHNFSLDSKAALNLPLGHQRQERIDALFWLAAAQNRQGILYHDLPLVKAGVDILLPLYSEYCDDLNYFVSLALALEYLGHYEHALYYLYEALGQFPKVAHIDDMVAQVASKLSLSECDFSFNAKARQAWQELLDNVPTINSYLAIVNPSIGEQQILNDLVIAPFKHICNFFDVQIHNHAQEVYFYFSSHGDESLLIVLEHCLTLKRDGFPNNWHFVVGLAPALDICLDIDGLKFDTSQIWCSLKQAPESHGLSNSRLNLCALKLLNSKVSHSNSCPKIEPNLTKLVNGKQPSDLTYDPLYETNLTNNLGQKSKANDNPKTKLDLNTKVETNDNKLDISQLDPDLFPDLFDDEEPSLELADQAYGQDELNIQSLPFYNLELSLYHPLLFTWFKSSKSQHPLVLERMVKTLACFALGELNTISLFSNISMIKSKEALSYQLSKLDRVLDAMDIKACDSYEHLLSHSYFVEYPSNEVLGHTIRSSICISVHNNRKLYQEFYSNSCDHSAINLLCAGCVPCYFALKRHDLDIDTSITHEDLLSVIELFIERYSNYMIDHGYQYSCHLMGYAFNQDDIFLDILAFDFKLLVHALSSFLNEHYPKIISLRSGLMVKGSVSSSIDFVKEN